MDLYDDTPTDIQIKSFIDNHQNFTVVAGAGSGKTGSLIKTLVYIRKKRGKLLRVRGQQIACITFTKAAVNVIKQRTNLDNLFLISTIHSFLWGLVANYQSDIRTTLRDNLIPQRIARKEEDDNGGQSKKAIKAREQIVRFTSDLDNLSEVSRFSYSDGNSRNYSKGQLNHDDIIDLVSIMISKKPILQTIIRHQFPYILIDEAQDTFPNVMEALNIIAQDEGLPIIGYFGDPMQQIYDNRAGEFIGPKGAMVITKPENYRCSTEVIKLLNVIHPELQQKPGLKNVTGSVKILLIQAERGTGYRNTYSEEQVTRALVEFDKAVAHFGWSKSKNIIQLFLTWQMIARRVGFSNLNHLFTGRYASESTEDAFKKGNHFALQPFMDVLINLVEASNNQDQVTLTQVLRKHSPILDPKGVNEFTTISKVKNQVKTAIDDLVTVWDHSSIREILEFAIKRELVTVSERLADHLVRPPREEDFDEAQHSREKEDWLIDEYLSYPTNELLQYKNFILESTPFGTQHGAKGEEYEKVLVVFDDTEANWHNFNFSRLLTPISVGKDATEGQRFRSLRLAYVCFSRAMQDLRIILYTADPLKSKNELVQKGLFTDEQISIQLLA